MQGGRDLLLADAAPDRRRRDRAPAAHLTRYLPLRRSTWIIAEQPGPEVDLRL